MHVDHGLHPDSHAWAAHALELAGSLGVPCIVRAIRIARRRGESPEAAARAARYGELGSSLAEGEVLLTAHHEDDQLETVLLQLLRGAGVAGLAAMPEVMRFARGWLVRPLLTRSRAQLLAWVRGSRLDCLDDPSNLDERFDRNFLRRRVLPVIGERWPAAAATVHRSARHAAEAQRLLDELAQADLRSARHGEALSGSALRALPMDRRRNALRFWISARGQPVPPTARLNEIAGSLLAARADAHPSVEWPGGRVERDAGLLTLRRPAGARRAAAGRRDAVTAGAAAAAIGWRWRTAPVCSLPDGLGQLELRPESQGPLDLSALTSRLTVRWRQGGERLTVSAGRPRRALKSLLQEARVPVGERARLPLVFAGDRLVAVADLWLDQSVQAGPGARRRARLVWKLP